MFIRKTNIQSNTVDRSCLVIFTIIILLLLYGEFFILKSSFTLGDEQYFCLFDDAMISMRYAKNLANGHGLVWNVGEAPLEGYTNFLWVGMMAGLHLFSIPESKICLPVQICSLILLCVNLLYVRRIATILTQDSFRATTGALILTAFYFPLNKWSLMGMETGAVTLIVSMAVYHMLKMYQEDRFSSACYFILGIGTLVRIDVFLLFGITIILLSVLEAKNRKRHLVQGFGVLILFLGAQTIFRAWYFGDILPNTYYLKMTGYPVWLRITNGLHTAFYFVYGMNAILFLLPFGLLLFRRNKSIIICAVLVLSQFLYSIYTGGDITDATGLANRFMCIVMPLFFILLCYALLLCGTRLNEALGQFYQSRSRLFHAGYPAAFVLCLLYLNAGPAFQYATQWLIMKPMEMVAANKDLVISAHYIRSITKPDASVAVTWAGILPYFLDRPVIDLLGKNDKKIARMNVDIEKYFTYSDQSKYIAFMPGHTKWDYRYSIGRLQPDIVWQLFPDNNFRLTQTAMEEAFPYLHGKYIAKKFYKFEFFAKNKSNKIDWNKI